MRPEISLAQDSTGRLTLSMSGRQRAKKADLTSAGNHSRSFQWPILSPLTCPRRTITAGSPARSATFWRMRSAIHLDSPYPVPSAEEGSRATSGTGAGTVQSAGEKGHGMSI